jgi:plastocyanin
MRPGAPALASLLLVLCLGEAARSEDVARIDGQVRLDVPGAPVEAVGPIVVFLEPLERAAPQRAPRGPVEIKQENARFHPSFRAIVAGQTVEMPNFDGIYHNVFSYSRPNDFDLGTYPTGESRSITFEHPGIVKVYCSIHERMNATIFVAPSPWFAVAGAAGRYAIADVPAGRYVLRTWAERLPPTERTLDLAGGERRTVDVIVTGDAR